MVLGVAAHACGDADSPAGPSPKAEGGQLSPGSTPSCYLPSEVIREYEGENEILTLTFEIESLESLCAIDMLDKGIMFGGHGPGHLLEHVRRPGCRA